MSVPEAESRPPRKRRRRRRRPGAAADPSGRGSSGPGADAPAEGPGEAEGRPVAADPADVASPEDAASPEECAFAEFGLGPALVAVLTDCAYLQPTPIQSAAIPPALEGRDIVGQARTGTGKTVAFLVPALEKLSDRPGPRVLVVVPTRELAMQVAEEAQRLGGPLGVRALAIYGGDPMQGQLKALKEGVQIIAATPGRLLDHMSRRTLKLADLDVAVLDEADRMFDLGFRDDIAKILNRAKPRRQTLLFSATLSDEVLGLASKHMSDPVKVFISSDTMTVDEVNQTFYPVAHDRKRSMLLELLRREQPGRTIVFTRTKAGADRLADVMKRKSMPAHEIHGDLPQKKRERILRDFKDGKVKWLIATDVAARGLDIDDISHVINYDIPQHAEDYVHRVGRTARMGKEGDAVTFVTPEDGEFLTAIEKLINQEITYQRMEGFDHGVTEREQKDTREDLEGRLASEYERTLHGYVRRRTRR